MKGTSTFFESLRGLCKVIALFLGLIFSVGYVHTLPGLSEMVKILLALAVIIAFIWWSSKFGIETPKKKERKTRSNSRTRYRAKTRTRTRARRYYPSSSRSSYTYNAPYEDSI